MLQPAPVEVPSLPPNNATYSQAVRLGDFIFVSGQVPRDPKTGEMIGGDIEAQTWQVMKNVANVLAAAGAELSDIVSVIVYLENPDLWGRFNTLYKEIMPQPFPTRTAVGASLRGILVEVSAVAYKPVR
jgi:2-iminobutanoate/2-iminopropanoate deaminase